LVYPEFLAGVTALLTGITEPLGNTVVSWDKKFTNVFFNLTQSAH